MLLPYHSVSLCRAFWKPSKPRFPAKNVLNELRVAGVIDLLQILAQAHCASIGCPTCQQAHNKQTSLYRRTVAGNKLCCINRDHLAGESASLQRVCRIEIRLRVSVFGDTLQQASATLLLSSSFVAAKRHFLALLGTDKLQERPSLHQSQHSTLQAH
jgi:hypothetical protein